MFLKQNTQINQNKMRNQSSAEYSLAQFQTSNDLNVVQPRKFIPDQSQTSGIDISFYNLSYSVQVLDEKSENKRIFCRKKYQKFILKNIKGIFKSGQLNAIMGASGSGKTSLLNILACRTKFNKGGSIKANNSSYNRQTFGYFASYVTQNDILMENLTVRQTLQFAAKLKTNNSKLNCKKLVNDLAIELKLQKCLDTFVGGVFHKGISGGQKRRTSIALQIIYEPTSGLDSLTSYIIVFCLRKLAKNFDKTIIMSIHQPNKQIFKLFDHFTLIDQGRMIYQGTSNRFESYFKEYFDLICPQFSNVSDFIMSIVHDQRQKQTQIYDSFFSTYQRQLQNQVILQIQDRNTLQIIQKSNFQPSYGLIMKTLCYRNIITYFRNPLLWQFKLVQVLFIAFFSGGIYFGIGNKDYLDKQIWLMISGLIFTITIGSLISTMQPISMSFPLQRDVFIKQQKSKMYTVTQYYIARNLVQLPELIIYPFIYVTILYYMSGLSNTPEQYLFHVLVNFLISFVGSSQGLLIGSIITDIKIVPVALTLLMLPLITFSGFFKNRNDLPGWCSWIQNISPNKYGFTALLLNQVENKPSYVATLNFNFNKQQSVYALIIMCVFLRILALICLWLTKKLKS